MAKDFIQVLVQCESTEVNLLISPDNKLVKRLVELKVKFDQSFECLLNELNELNLSVVNNAINNPTKEEKEKIE